MNSNLITRKDLSLQMRENKFENGTFLHYKGGRGLELHKIVGVETDGTFFITRFSLPYFEVVNEPQRVSLATLQQFYRPVTVPMDKLHELAQRLLDGEEMEDFGTGGDEGDSTSLMYLGDKSTLVAMRKELAQTMEVAEMVRRHAQCMVDEMRNRMMEQVQKIESAIAGMQKQAERLDYVIQTIETYAGIKEEILIIRQGVPADGTFPVVIRQAVIYLDEEMALIDPEFDWQKMESFDKWLLENDNYKILLPDTKSIVAIKPRRHDKKYSSGETAADRYYNWVMNENNRVTLFLIRNGENLYRLASEHIHLQDRLFPNPGELEELIEKEKKSPWRNGDDNSESTWFKKRFTKVSFLLQGLLERSDVFAPHNFTGSLIKMVGLDGHIEMNYELDTSRLLSDGRPLFRDWRVQLNANLTEGKRILLINKGYNRSGYEFERMDYVTYYSNDWNIPGYPDDGVYTLYKSNPKGYSEHYAKNHPFVIKFFGENPTWSWGTGMKERRNRTSIHIDPQEPGILNYDDLKMEDVDYYLNSRLHRSQYSQFVVMLQKVKLMMLEEQRQEEDFIRMMEGQIIGRGMTVKDGYTPAEVVRKALDSVKNRLKWKRPVSTKEKETYTLVERKLFSKEFTAKYFKEITCS